MIITRRSLRRLALALLAVIALILLPAAAETSELIDRYDTGGLPFSKHEIAGKFVVYYHQRMLGEAVVEKDYIVYQFDAASGELLARKDHWRKDLPEAPPEIRVDRTQALAIIEGEVQSAELYIISPESDVFPIEPAPKNPCWIVRSIRNGDLVIEIIDAVDGVFLGYGVPPPYNAFSLTGPQYSSPCSGAWTPWSESAEYWFNAMGYSTEEIVWPTQATVQGRIQSSEIALFYELAHGGSESFASGCVNGQSYETTFASEISTWITAYEKMPFTFIGSCGGMCATGAGSLSHAFRKGSLEHTATVGYCDMAEEICSVCWTYSLDWQDALFAYMSQGYTVKDAFDQADADYPQCSAYACMRFAGDESFTVVPLVVREPGACSVLPRSIDFGALAVGSFKDTTITIKNTWEEALAGTVSESCEFFEITSGGGPYTLGPGDSVVVTVRYAPTNAGAHECLVETGDAFCSDVLCRGEAPSPVHYVSPSGSNTFPYASASTAAHAIADAVAAAETGDSVLVVSATFVCGQVTIDCGIGLYGGWNEGFTVRSPETARTVIDFAVTGALQVTSGPDTCRIDGFSFENGRGVKMTDSALRIRDTVIRSSTGSGLRCTEGSLVVEDCSIIENSSGRGAGVYIIACTASISNSTVSGNSLVLTTEIPNGAGVLIAGCTGVRLEGCAIDGNTAALNGANGGGVYVEYSTGVEIIGGSISDNQAAFGGGGMFVLGSEVVVSGVRLASNQTVMGGAVNVSGGAGAAFYECEFRDNTATIGGGIYASSVPVEIAHNVFVENAASASGGACYLNGTDGSFIGNTLDSSAGDAVFFLSTSLPVVNNIVTNTTGSGFKASGASTPTPVYCDSWNNTIDFDGCSAGTGCVSLDPLYVNAAGGDYRLGLHSPAIDAGDPDPARNDPDGSRGDMGAYGSHAFAMEQPEYPKNLSAAVVSGNAVVKWSANPEPDVAGYAVYKDADPDFVPSAATFVSLVSAPDTTYDDGPFVSGTQYKVSAVDEDGYASGYAGPVELDVTGIGERPAGWTFRLDQNRPNPFNPSTRIGYEVGARSKVTLDVFDVTGSLVKRVVDEAKGPGSYTAEWDGTNAKGERVSTGVYFYRLTAGTFSQTKKMVILK